MTQYSFLNTDIIYKSKEFNDFICSEIYFTENDILFEVKKPKKMVDKSSQPNNTTKEQNKTTKDSKASITDNTNTSENTNTEEKENIRYVPLNSVRCASLLVERSPIRYLSIYLGSKDYCFYYPVLGHHLTLNERELALLIADIFSFVVSEDKEKSFTHEYILSVIHQLHYVRSICHWGQPIVTKFSVYMNGVLDDEKNTLYPLSSQYLAFSKLPFDCLTENIDTKKLKEVAPNTYQFLTELCNYDLLLIEYFRAIVKNILLKTNKYQVIFLFHGPGGTGKSTAINLIMALLSPDRCVTSDLKTLQRDKFEIETLQEKDLLIIPDLEEKPVDLNVLKQIIGNDTIKAREKFKQGGKEIVFEGNAIMATNHVISFQDTSDALLRRFRVFPAIKKVNLLDRKTLIMRTKGGFEGPLVNELKYTSAWVRSMENYEAKTYIQDPGSKVKTVQVATNELIYNVNPMIRWFEEFVVETLNNKWYSSSCTRARRPIVIHK